ncbi:galanin receptor 2b isoform X1 [Hydra vulgaris]|uniref:galanin receptor 2b isoform X1 n=2 Tax=Hydra vulgaris TaxID=6087 RepID=UPI001F5F2525|nr:galanin receptor 2b isoform X1 [Hydra vulgaris]XP_047133244.1 galanin receptor 2b isoform X1 [Hydra vulgaris]XP_047133252.1 galanin receptor 2b isoform X1 [Hydra vulgaris]XP_047133259.1 galanin receptor 2b isoform X1 [Hydra vulgaris]
MNITEYTSVFQQETWQLFWYAIIGIFGFIGNGIVMTVILLSKKINRKSSFNVAIFSLALADFLVSILGLPIYYMSTDSFKNHPIGKKGDWMCMLLTGYFLPYWFLDASVFLLVYIAIERRNTILYYNSLKLNSSSFRTKLLTMVAIYLFALIVQFSSAYFLVYDTEKKEFGNYCRYNLSQNQSAVLKIILFTVDTLVPIVVISYCFYQIFLSLKIIDKLLRKSMVTPTCKRIKIDVVHDRKVRTIKTIVIIALAFCICIIPNQLLFVLSSIHKSFFAWNGITSQIFVLMRFSNSFVNPFVYCFQSKEFRKHFSSMLVFNFRKKYLTPTGCKYSDYQQLPDITLK